MSWDELARRRPPSRDRTTPSLLRRQIPSQDEAVGCLRSSLWAIVSGAVLFAAVTIPRPPSVADGRFSAEDLMAIGLLATLVAWPLSRAYRATELGPRNPPLQYDQGMRVIAAAGALAALAGGLWWMLGRVA